MVTVDYFKNHDDYIEFKVGDVIFDQGDSSNKIMYAVKEGEVDIVYGDKVVESVESGRFFGEMSLVDAAPRAAAAIAKTDCKIVPVDKYHFLYLLHETPSFALQVMHVMAERIRTLNTMI
jgi:CRP/FNR family transcriptional regulator, cyclic AMP receptor protein